MSPSSQVGGPLLVGPFGSSDGRADSSKPRTPMPRAAAPIAIPAIPTPNPVLDAGETTTVSRPELARSSKRRDALVPPPMMRYRPVAGTHSSQGDVQAT